MLVVLNLREILQNLCHILLIFLTSIFLRQLWCISRPGWMELWAPWAGGSCPCWWQRGWNQMIF